MSKWVKVISLRGLRLEPVDKAAALESCIELSKQLYFTKHTLVVVNENQYYVTVGSLMICEGADIPMQCSESIKDVAPLQLDVELTIVECGFRILNKHGKLCSSTSLGSVLTSEDFLEEVAGE